jgi:multimeric flavodoxin WrbA
VDTLLEHIRSIQDYDELHKYLAEEAQIHFQQFLDSGRAEGIPFDTLYAKLRKLAGEKGLCNSEIGMAAALWGAHKIGCDIDYAPLSSYFGPTGAAKELNQLKQQILEADGLLICTPVYFGGRSSLASDFIELLRRDEELCQHLKGKPVAGVSVGAKRNGGQETTLIYQLLEVTGMGMLGVGNDSETTSQYGGTIKAGDIGTAVDDEYGLNTAMGTGRRVGRVAYELTMAKKTRLTDKLRVLFWILQDDDEQFALQQVQKLIKEAGEEIQAQLIEAVDGNIGRCIACDICPTHVGADIEYRCVIKRKSDEFTKIHEEFLDHDLIVPVTLSLKNRSKLTTVYQRFIERTRYLRRGDYLFTDVAVLPLVFEELGATENMHIRMLTSMIRHHTIVLKSNIGYLQQDQLLNWDEVNSNWKQALQIATQITVARLAATATSTKKSIQYNPVGYVLSAAADKELSLAERRETLQQDREFRSTKDAITRLKIDENNP